MRTRVFISWSGDLSKALAETLKVWLPSALQNVLPYFSPDDIEKGAKWDSSIAAELEQSNIGLICLTSDNTEKPWILFEAGALSKSINKGRVCTILFGLDPSQIKGPLVGFQATQFTKEDFRKLTQTINNAAGDDALESAVFDAVFEMWWPQIESQVGALLQEHRKRTPAPKGRGEKDILEEVLELSRMAASRNARNFTPSIGALEDLIDQIAELLSLVPMDDAHRIAANISRPLNHIARAADSPEKLLDLELIRRRLVRGRPGVGDSARRQSGSAAKDASSTA